jgi:2-oxoglutarate dehydrogenase E2 component (dihydrolipoamide succinyltransferase)
MSTQIVVPSLGESVTEATVANWFKKVGDAVAQDEPICELETDKVTLEVNAPAAGVLESIAAEAGATVEMGAVLGSIKAGAAGAAPSKTEAAGKEAAKNTGGAEPASNAPAAATPLAVDKNSPNANHGPAASKALAENPQVKAENVSGSGKDGRLTKGDVLEAAKAPAAPAAAASAPAATGPREERVKMTKLRQTIAKRLKDSQNTAAILTTFNEIDMSNVMALREEYKEAFEKKHGVRLGFMSFFTKAVIHALKEVPAVNAQIDGDSLIYKNYYDIGMAVGTDQGLVVPVVRNADQLSLAGIEAEIGRLAKKARDGSLSMADMTGGTFTITNGGVYGSLLSTPIINPPQSGILGMHKVEKRPVVVDNQIVIRPMMYVALSYDHRIIDGKESVTFLVKVKEAMEDPRRLLLGV